jgi:hypothetical protein
MILLLLIAAQTDWTGHKGTVTALCYFRDGKTLASGAKDGDMILWDTIHGKVRHRLSGHRAPGESRIGRMCLCPERPYRAGQWRRLLARWRPSRLGRVGRHPAVMERRQGRTGTQRPHRIRSRDRLHSRWKASLFGREGRKASDGLVRGLALRTDSQVLASAAETVR